MNEELRLLVDLLSRNDKHCDMCHGEILEIYKKKLMELQK